MTRLGLEQRSESRLAPAPAHRNASLKLLGEAGLGHAPDLPVEIVNLSGSGARILATVPAPAGALVRIDWEQTMLLGEVCYAEPTADGRFALGLRLEHSLVHTESLERLRQRFADFQ